MKKKDQKTTPQNREKKKEQEAEKQLDMSQDIVGRIVESLKIEIVQGRELLEKEVRKEMKGLARRIEAMEERWKKKEEEMGKKIEEMLEQMKEVQNKERQRREEEKEEAVEEVMEKIEEKINERDRRQEEKEMERTKEAWNEVKRIHRKLEERERREKKNKIVIRGLEVPKREAKEKTRQFLTEEFGVKEGIVGIEIIGGGEIAKVSIVEMENWEAKQEVMKKKGKLRGKRIYIDHDMTQEERRVQKLLREKAREEINEGREAKVGYRKIKILNKWYRWNEEKGEIERESLKKKDRDFWQHIEKYDFVELVETWMEDKDWSKVVSRLPDGYKWRYQTAERENKRGRAKGGILTGVKKELCAGEKEWEDKGVMERKIKIKNEKWSIWTIYNGEGMKNVVRKLERGIAEKEEEYIIIGGDMNARVGTEGSLGVGWTEDDEKGSRRKSKDKTINR
ncbi:golgin subfamily A member 6-like protein 22 [Ceratina calcarata]|uniref:Golgin subfamily A member 6-like protein 22 n=1 Tax=Ceratina calcarata TaxID=156304 RepID=A0AAJ7ND12_9HYME|nr:golgin subfamily A member 6-like protein 22 [Ceratina calcarata]